MNNKILEIGFKFRDKIPYKNRYYEVFSVDKSSDKVTVLAHESCEGEVRGHLVDINLYIYRQAFLDGDYVEYNN